MEGNVPANHSESRAVGPTMAVCEVSASGYSGGRVTGKDTSVWQIGKNLSMNNVGQPSARSVNLGLGEEVGWQSIDADREASAAEISRDEPVAL